MPSVGQEIITSLKEVIAWAGGGNVPVRVTKMQVQTVNVRAARRRLGLSQSACRGQVRLPNSNSGELGTRPHPAGPARVLLASILFT